MGVAALKTWVETPPCGAGTLSVGARDEVDSTRPHTSTVQGGALVIHTTLREPGATAAGARRGRGNPGVLLNQHGVFWIAEVDLSHAPGPLGGVLRFPGIGGGHQNSHPCEGSKTRSNSAAITPAQQGTTENNLHLTKPAISNSTAPTPHAPRAS